VGYHAVCLYSAVNPFHVCFAVSTTGDALGTFRRYKIAAQLFPALAKMALWKDKLIVTTLDLGEFGPEFVTVFVTNWDQMVNGEELTNVLEFSIPFALDDQPIVGAGLLAATVDGFYEPDGDAAIPLFGIEDNEGPAPLATVDAIHVWELRLGCPS
jgi:hypothetical protein